MTKDNQDKRASQKPNTHSLMADYNSIINRDLDADQEEFAEEQTNPGLMSTYNQMLDAYRQGTIDRKDKNEDK